jgi:tetrahydromethanopterin S-methyltransferase subunit B
MDSATFSQSPFTVLTFIAAPAVLTNATSVLAMSTINRMLRTRERMHQLYEDSHKRQYTPDEAAHLLGQVNRVERQASHMLRALHSVYVALGAFAAASLVTLLGAVLGNMDARILFGIVVGIGLVLGFTGVGGILVACWNLLQTTRLSLANIRDEADLIRQQQEAVRLRLAANL